MELKRGDVVLARLSGEGREQAGVRPVIIFSNNMANKFSPVINVIPLTSKMDKKPIPVHLTICKSQYPLQSDSIALCEQEGKIDKSRIIGNVLFSLNQLEMKRLERCMMIQLGMESVNTKAI